MPLTSPRLQTKSHVAVIILLVTLGFLGGCASQDSTLRSTQEHGANEVKLQTIVTSPSHPSTLVVGTNDKLSQNLEWSEATGTLTAQVTYSEVSGAGLAEVDPSDYRTYFLPFPTVKLDAQNNLVVSAPLQKDIVLGYLKEGPLGTRVVLKDNIRLVAHRRDGILSASLASTTTTE